MSGPQSRGNPIYAEPSHASDGSFYHFSAWAFRQRRKAMMRYGILQVEHTSIAWLFGRDHFV